MALTDGAHGEQTDDKIQTVPKDKVPDGVEVGTQLQAGQVRRTPRWPGSWANFSLL
jgi:FKBP-type peptidyl-prolyl cis-trans isomerase 2